MGAYSIAVGCDGKAKGNLDGLSPEERTRLVELLQEIRRVGLLEERPEPLVDIDRDSYKRSEWAV